MTYYDALETRSADQRSAEQTQALRIQIERALSAPGLAAHLQGIGPGDVASVADLAKLPVLRKSDLVQAQATRPPFGGFSVKPARHFHHVFQSPGPIYEPGSTDHDWWRMGRFIHAAG
ncbi:MAG: phenylacetate--CoA ligase family protein, partial [Ruegeria sp.]|nr:phenylacetate--CoA ligase family protein [Ruegeria sp.]